MGLGAVIFAIASLLGLNAVLLATPTLYVALKLSGGIYLAYLGFCIWRGAKQSFEVSAGANSESTKPRKNHLLLGFATQISNPKTAIVYASVFAAFLPLSPSIQYNIAVVALVFFIEAGWYTIVAIALSFEAPRSTYLRYKKWVDRFAGSVMGALGIKLALSFFSGPEMRV
jgi:threonine/homoserine/homoserine lactone efflux protein